MTDDPPRHRQFDLTSAQPGPFRGVFSETFRLICWVYLKLGGWTIKGDWPDIPKMVLVAAPHTSNWDGVNMLAAAGYYRIKLRWMGKKSLTTGPLGGIVKWLGCVPVDRSSNNDVVTQMRDAFAAATDLVLAIPPEGTRSSVAEWKSGFYHIAHTARVPIVMSVLDYGTRTIKLSGALDTGGDYEADLALIKSHYKDAAGKYPDNFRV
ncbi:MAG: 1-acyl-sn-glycerol-3-phosphate acyltransferase [Pseudomonadota bacterium]